MTATPVRVRLLVDRPSDGLFAGDVLRCVPSWLYQGTKLTVLTRESDGFDPACNVDVSQVAEIV